MPRFPRLPIAMLVLALATPAGPACAQARPDPIGTFRSSESLGTEYRDMGAAIAQIQTVKRVPFFNLDGKQRVERFSTLGGAIKEKNFKVAAGQLQQDFSSGLLKDISTIFLTDVLTKVAKGQDFNDAMTDTVKGMTSKEFLAGNLLGGTLGAALGSAIPVPMIPGLAGQMMGNLPMLAGAMLGTRIGINLVSGRDAFEGIKALEFVTQAVGSSVGMVLGGLLPVPTLGPIVGGAIGGSAGLKFAAWLREHFEKGRGHFLAQAGRDSNPASAPAQAESASPQAPQDSAGIAGLDPVSLKKLTDDHYRSYLKAAASGNPAAAAVSLAAYKQAQQALSAQR